MDSIDATDWPNEVDCEHICDKKLRVEQECISTFWDGTARDGWGAGRVWEVGSVLSQISERTNKFPCMRRIDLSPIGFYFFLMQLLQMMQKNTRITINPEDRFKIDVRKEEALREATMQGAQLRTNATHSEVSRNKCHT